MPKLVSRDNLAAELAKRAEIPLSAARDEVMWFFDNIGKQLKAGNQVRIHGFGTFRTVARAAGMKRNPHTGEDVMVPAHRVLRFKPGTTLASEIRGSAKSRTKSKATMAKSTTKKKTTAKKKTAV